MKDKNKVKVYTVNPIERIRQLIKHEYIKYKGENITKEQVINAIEDFIIYDPNVTKSNKAYTRRLQHYHDGTLCFWYDYYTELLITLVQKSSCSIFDEKFGPVKDIKYRVGDIMVIDDFEPHNPPKSWAMKTSMVMPVITELLTDDGWIEAHKIDNEM